MPAETKTALLDAAEQLLRRRGYDGFSYADLSRAVGITKASIHHHFPAKADLAVALMQRYAADFDALRADLLARHASAGARLAALIAHYRQVLEGGSCLCLCVALATSPDRLSPALRAEMAQFRAGVLGWLRDVFAQAQDDGSISALTDPAAEAASTLALLEGAQLAARSAGQIGDFDQALALLARRICDATSA